MPSYHILKPLSVSLDEPLFVGDAFRWNDEVVWKVATVEPTGDNSYRVELEPWPGEERYPATIKGTSA